MHKEMNRKTQGNHIKALISKLAVLSLCVGLLPAFQAMAASLEEDNFEEDYAAESALYEMEDQMDEVWEDDLEIVLDDGEFEDTDIFIEEDMPLSNEENGTVALNEETVTDPTWNIQGQEAKDLLSANELFPEDQEYDQDENEPALSGECGQKDGTVFWELDEEGILHISGKGRMKDWEKKEDVPWYPVSDRIISLDLQKGITYIGSYAFSACYAMKSVRVG